MRKGMNQPTEERTILFADLAGSTALYDRLGDLAAQTLIEGVLASLGRCTADHGGEVIKTIGDEVMCSFPAPAAAAEAALRMQRESRPPVTLRIGFHHGAVIRTPGDAFGDCVNQASRLTTAARGGQILVSESAVLSLPPGLSQHVRPYDVDTFKGKDRATHVYELMWEEASDVTRLAARTQPVQRGPGGPRLRIAAGARVVEIGPEDLGNYTLGRDATCALRLHAPLASRIHAALEYRRGKFVISDHSTNGTYVVDKAGREVMIRRESMPLVGSGVISLGCPLAEQTGEVLRYETGE